MTNSPGASAPLLSQQIHLLVDDETRAFTLGAAIAAAEGSERQPNEGAVGRRLLALAIPVARERMGEREYARVMALGRAEIDRRKAERQRADGRRTDA
jgi:hypothetical protein